MADAPLADARSELVCSVFALSPGFVDDQNWRALWALARVGRAWQAAFCGALRHLPDRLAADVAALGAALGASPEAARRLAAPLDSLETVAIAEILRIKRLPFGMNQLLYAAAVLCGICRPVHDWQREIRSVPELWPTAQRAIGKAGGGRALLEALRATDAASLNVARTSSRAREDAGCVDEDDHVAARTIFHIAEDRIAVASHVCDEPWFTVEDMRRKSSVGVALVVWITTLMDLRELHTQNPSASRRYMVVLSRVVDVRDRLAYVAARPYVCAETGRRFRTAAERSAHRADLRLEARARTAVKRLPASFFPADSERPASASGTARPATAPRRRRPAAAIRRLAPGQERREAAAKTLGERPRWR